MTGTATCRHGHAMDQANVYTRPDGSVECRRCRSESLTRFRARRAAGVQLERVSPEDRFWARCVYDPNTDCFLWAGDTNDKGYGLVWFGGRTRQAHRVAYEIARGPIPDGMLVCHSCDTPPCVNPGHFFIGTVSDNAVDMVRKGRHRNQFKGRTACSRGHTYTAENTRIKSLKSGRVGRYCRACEGVRKKEAAHVSAIS